MLQENRWNKNVICSLFRLCSVSLACMHTSTHESFCRARVLTCAVRLVEGIRPEVGRLEVYHNGVWGTVCDDQFTDANARVFCYMIGYGLIFSFYFISHQNTQKQRAN